jgi:alpha-N-arabinofuranosidase
VAAIVDSVAGRRHSRRKVNLSVDEWNVWYLGAHLAAQDPTGPFRRAPALAEDEHDLADALVVGCLLITLLRHADRVRIACLAQLVNVIPAIRTTNGGPAWRQTTSYPFADVARFGRGTVLRTELDAPTYSAEGEDDVDSIEFVAVHDAALERLTIFAVNRTARPLTLEAVLRDLDRLTIDEHVVLADADIRASNTAAHPDRVVPTPAPGALMFDGRLAATLPARSWNVIRLSARALA